MRKSTLIKALAFLLSFAMLMTGLPAPSIAESVDTATDTVVEQTEDIVIEDDPVLTEDEEVHEEPELPVEEPEEPPVEDDPVTEPEVPTEDVEDAVFPEDDTESADTAGDDADVDADPSEEIEEPADDELVIEDETDTEQPIESLPEEDPDTPDEPVVEDDPIISDETIEDEPITEDETEDAPVVVEHPVQVAVAANGYAYLMAEQSIAVYNTSELYEQTYTVHGGVLLVTDFLELDGWYIVEVQFMTATGKAVLAYAYADELPEQPLTNGEVSAVAQMTSYALVMLDYGEAFMFMVEAEPVGAVVDEIPSVEEQPSEIPEIPEISEIPVVNDESEDEEILMELPIEEEPLAAEGDFVLVTTDTRAFLAVDDSAADDYEGDLTLGFFVNEAAVQVDAIEQDSLGRYWYGSYTIRELSAPDGYLTSREEIAVTIDADYRSSDKPIATVKNHFKRVQFIKVDTSGKYLPGVEFSLINAVTHEVVETAVSNDKGEFIFTKFDYGDWIIRETAAPEGYNRMEDYLLHVDENWTEPKPITLVNIPSTYMFFKSDNKKNALAGATFAVEDENGNVVQEVVSAENGVVYIYGLTPGKYTIRETATVEGFTVSDDTITVEINEKYKVPTKLKRFVNYPSISTGVDVSPTALTWVGIGLVGIAGLIVALNSVMGGKKHPKRRRK